MKKETIQKILQIVKENGIVRPLDLDSCGLPREYLSRLYRRGLLTKTGRGLYVHPDAEPTELRTLAEVSKRVPEGVVCLVSALQYHELTTQMPPVVWLAIDRKARMPHVPQLPLKIVRFSGKALTEGIEEQKIEGVPVKVYTPAKTAADCFKYRNKIGVNVAVDALRECRRYHKCANDDLYYFAGICRVWSIMRPYLEAML